MQVEFHFDFASPNAYLAHRIVPLIEARTGARFRYIPVLLSLVLEATGNRFVPGRNQQTYERLQTERFIRRHRIEGFVRNPFFPFDTLQVMRGAAAAEIDGTLPRYLDAMFHHMWEAPKKLHEPDVLHGAFTASGLDATAIMNRVQDKDVKARLIANTQFSVSRGAFGAPTFFVGDGLYFGKESLRDLEESILGIA